MVIPYEKSFASSPVSLYWSSRNNKKPEDVPKSSHSKYWFKCNKCNHEYDQLLYTIRNRPRCPYCSVASKKLCDNLECITCFNRSFASHSRAYSFINDNPITARFVFKSSTKNYKFHCDTCDHIFIATPNHINNNRWCPYCSGKLCTNTNCIECFNKSFACHYMAKCWSTKNNCDPRAISKYSNKKYIFNCSVCNYEFNCILNSMKGQMYCPVCVNKTEKILYLWLCEKFVDIVHQPKFSWCKNDKTNKFLPFDFMHKNIIIELDGPQHYTQIRNWKSPEEIQKTDNYKMECALNNNKHIIRILQTDVMFNYNNWDIKLYNTINELLIKSEPTIIYINMDHILSHIKQ
jgi:hypothetical protein